MSETLEVGYKSPPTLLLPSKNKEERIIFGFSILSFRNLSPIIDTTTDGCPGRNG